MSVLVTGSIGIDTVTTPQGKSENCLGGSAKLSDGKALIRAI
jgi:hypothetical protein